MKAMAQQWATEIEDLENRKRQLADGLVKIDTGGGLITTGQDGLEGYTTGNGDVHINGTDTRVGPGSLSSDAYMMGIEPVTQRQRMDESLTAIMALLSRWSGGLLDRFGASENRAPHAFGRRGVHGHRPRRLRSG